MLSTDFKGKHRWITWIRSSFCGTGRLTPRLDYSFGSRPAVFAPLLGCGIFTQEGAAWKHSRELLRKQFARAKYHNLESSFREHVDNLIDCLPSHGIIDLQPLFFRLTLDTATALLFGSSVYSLRADLDQAAENRVFSESFNIAQEGLAKRFRLAPFHFLYNPPAFRKACQDVHRFVETYIRKEGIELSTGWSEGTTSNDSASWFINQVAAESRTIADLRDQLLNVLLAGRDTTACCLSWTLSVLPQLALGSQLTPRNVVACSFATPKSWSAFDVRSTL